MPLNQTPFDRAQRQWRNLKDPDLLSLGLLSEIDWDIAKTCQDTVAVTGLFEIEMFIPQSVPDLGLGFDALGVEEDYLKPARRAERTVKPQEVRRIDMPGTKVKYRRSASRAFET